MTAEQLEAMKELSHARADEYLHIAKSMIMNEFGPATEHTHTEIAVSLAMAMMQHEGAQMVANALREKKS